MNKKIFTTEQLQKIVNNWHNEGKKIVFTNGCFDLVHRGHIEYLQKAKELGDKLVVGLNTDRSVRALKGPTRPFIGEEDRLVILAALESTDAVCLFDEDTPIALITKVKPHFLVKGGDYNLNEIVGREFVEKNGGEIKLIPFVSGRSTTELVEKIIQTESK